MRIGQNVHLFWITALLAKEKAVRPMYHAVSVLSLDQLANDVRG